MENPTIPLALLLLLQASSCVERSATPEDALRNYVDYRFGKNQSKNALLEKTTGELREDLERFSEKALNQMVDPDKYRRGSLNINLKKCSPSRCHLTYTFKYSQRGADKKESYKAVVKKIARLDLEGGSWKIAKVTEIKTHFDSKKPLDVDSPGETKNPFR